MAPYIRGSFHQGDPTLEGRGRQCTAMAMRALAHHAVKNIYYWDTKDMDTILQHGDGLFIEACKEHDVTVLFPSETIKTVHFNEVTVTFQTEHAKNGILLGNGADKNCPGYDNEDKQTFTLESALETVVKNCILTFGSVFSSYAIAIIKESSVYFVFDSHSRDAEGFSTFDGAACVTMHESLGELVSFIRKLSESVGLPGDCLFELVNVCAKVERDKESSTDEEDNIPLCQVKISKPPVLNVQTNSQVESDSDPELNLPLSKLRSEVYMEGDTDFDDVCDDTYMPTEEELKALDEGFSTDTEEEDNQDHEISFPQQITPLQVTKEKDVLGQLRCAESNITQESEVQAVLEVNLTDVTGNEMCNENDELSTSMGSSTMSSPTAADIPSKRLSRKRLRNVDEWKTNVKKRLRNTGKSYITRTGKVHRERTLKPGCGELCRQKCKSKVTDEERNSLFHSFWGMGCLSKQRDYLCRNVLKKEKGSTTKKADSRRSHTYEYSLELGGRKERVCKKMFLDTLDVSDTIVFTALKKRTCLGQTEPDMRGRYPHKGLGNEKEAIRNHINSFSRVESHYARKDSKKEYLESGLTLQKMYNLYLEKRQSEGCQQPASESTYRQVFNYEFNIGFFKRMKDRCDYCAGYENVKDHDEETEEQYKRHINLKEASRIYKDRVKAMLKDDETLDSAVFDLEEVLPAPSSFESSLYYKRKLNTYNLTVYRYRNGQGFCYVWPETEGLRGSNEIASCLYKYLENCSREGRKKVVLFSDSCGGQNRNKNFLTMLWYALHKFHLQEIEHVFFVTGHSQNEGDNMHSVIERASRHIPVYTPSQWAQVIRIAKRQAPHYIVDEMDVSQFVDFKKVAHVLKNFQLDSERDRIKWLQVKRFKLVSSSPHQVQVFYDYSDNYKELDLMQKSRKTQEIVCPSSIQLEKVARKQYQISKDKYSDLTSLCEKNIIPRAHHQYFFNLPHEN